MDKISATALRELTQEGWSNLVLILDLAAGDILGLTTEFNSDTGELKATGAKIVLLPKESHSALLPIQVHEIGIPAKPEKYLQLAAEKAHRTNTTNLFTSAESRDVAAGKYGGAHALSNHTGAVGLSGFTEADDHVILGLGMVHAGLIKKFFKPGVSKFHYWEHVEQTTFSIWQNYPIERYHEFEGIFSRAKTKLDNYKDDMEAVREYTAS